MICHVKVKDSINIVLLKWAFWLMVLNFTMSSAYLLILLCGDSTISQSLLTLLHLRTGSLVIFLLFWVASFLPLIPALALRLFLLRLFRQLNGLFLPLSPAMLFRRRGAILSLI